MLRPMSLLGYLVYRYICLYFYLYLYLYFVLKLELNCSKAAPQESYEYTDNEANYKDDVMFCNYECYTICQVLHSMFSQ